MLKCNTKISPLLLRYDIDWQTFNQWRCSSGPVTILIGKCQTSFSACVVGLD